MLNMTAGTIYCDANGPVAGPIATSFIILVVVKGDQYSLLSSTAHRIVQVCQGEGIEEVKSQRFEVGESEEGSYQLFPL